MKRILITGGAGFLGSNLCKRLLRDSENELLCLDNCFSGSKKNIEQLIQNPRFEFIRHDITFPIYLEVDEIYNLACPASPVYYQREPIQTLKTSVHGAINVLGLAKRLKAKVLQASTSEVYGDSIMQPQKENYWGNVNPIGVRSCYDEGKRCAETLFFDYYRKYQIRIKIARIFNTYGPAMRQDDGRVISNMITQALQDKAITVYGDGSQTRSFCYVDDMIEALILLMNTQSSLRGPYNLGNSDEITIFNLAKLIINLTSSKSHIEYRALPRDDPKKRRPDIALAEKHLGWRATTGLKEGLLNTIDYFKREPPS